MKKTLLAITIICAALWTCADISFADNNTIYACVMKSDGTIRIVSSLTDCKKNEGQLSWNIVGPVGAPGPQGEQGPRGLPGDSVVAGQQCAQGKVVIGFDQNRNIICQQLLYAIGDTGPAGGVVFYITDGGLHGLEAPPLDQHTFAQWGCQGTVIPGADGTAVGTGAQNTVDILANCDESGMAAKIADGYSLNGYDDWFLPSKDELNLLYQQKAVVGGFVNYNPYWSSTEARSDAAWVQSFDDGRLGYGYKGGLFRVRAVRAF